MGTKTGAYQHVYYPPIIIAHKRRSQQELQSKIANQALAFLYLMGLVYIVTYVYAK